MTIDRNSLPHRIAVLSCVALLGLVTNGTRQALAGGYTHVGNQVVHDARGRTYFVPECVPECETPPNWNLYWFNCASAIPGPCDNSGWIRPTSRPTWYAGAELVTYMRYSGSDVVYSRYGTDDMLGRAGQRAVSTDNLDDDFRAGVRAYLGRQLGDWYRIEAAYTGGFKWNEQFHLRNDDANSQSGTGTLTTALAPIGAAEALGLDYNDYVGISLKTQMDTVELNLRRKIAMPTPNAETSFLIGCRFSDIDEQFGYRAVANVPPASGAVNELAVGTKNDMVGLQLGMLAQFLDRSRLWIDFEIKGSINHNSTSQNTLYTNTDNNSVVTSYATSRSGSRAAFTGEVSLAVNCNFTRTLTLRAGYNALWIGGVALATENVSNSLSELQNGPGVLVNDGELFFHGPFLGLTWVR